MSAWMRDFSAFVIHYLSVEICGFCFFLFYLGFYCNVVEILLFFFFQFPKYSYKWLYGFGLKDTVTDPEPVEVSGRSQGLLSPLIRNCLFLSLLNTPMIYLQTYLGMRWNSGLYESRGKTHSLNSASPRFTEEPIWLYWDHSHYTNCMH